MTSPLGLRAAFTENPRTRGILDGTCVPRGTAFDVIALGPGDLFARQLQSAEFDVSELSISSLAIAVARGDRTWVGVPVFTTQYFFQTQPIVREGSDLHRLEQLRGKRVGVMEYQQTGVLWIRTILQRYYGIAPADMRWVMERPPERSHGGKTGFVPPPGIELTYVAEGSSLAAMLDAGDIDAILFYPEPEPGGIDDRTDGARARLRSRPLFDDPEAEGRRFLAQTGLHQINHGVVIRRSIADEHPWIVRSVYDALVTARDLAGGGADYPYGLAANRSTLDTILESSFEQGLLPRKMAAADIFVEP